MAATKAQGLRGVPGAFTQESLTVTGDTAYPTGGYVILPSDFGFQVLRDVIAAFFSTIGGMAYELSVVRTYNSDGVTLQQVNLALAVGSTGVQVANGTNVAAVGVTLVGLGN